MTVQALLDEVRRCGALIYRIGDVVRVRPISAIPPALAAELRTHKADILPLVPDYADGAAPLARVPQGSADSTPTFATATVKGTILAPTGTTDAIPIDEESYQDWLGLRIASRLLGEDVWLVPDDASAEALERDLGTEGDSTLVFTLAEVFALEGMLAADVKAIAKLKRTLTGAGLGGRIESVTRREGAA